MKILGFLLFSLLLLQMVCCVIIANKRTVDNNEVGDRIDLLANFFQKDHENRENIKNVIMGGLELIRPEEHKVSRENDDTRKFTLPPDSTQNLPPQRKVKLPTTLPYEPRGNQDPTLYHRQEEEEKKTFPKLNVPSWWPPKSKSDLKLVPKTSQTKIKLPKWTKQKSEELTSAERLDKANRAFDRLVQFIGIVGQVDSYIHDRASLAVRKIAAVMNEEDRFRQGQ